MHGCGRAAGVHLKNVALVKGPAAEGRAVEISIACLDQSGNGFVAFRHRGEAVQQGERPSRSSSEDFAEALGSASNSCAINLSGRRFQQYTFRLPSIAINEAMKQRIDSLGVNLENRTKTRPRASGSSTVKFSGTCQGDPGKRFVSVRRIIEAVKGGESSGRGDLKNRAIAGTDGPAKLGRTVVIAVDSFYQRSIGELSILAAEVVKNRQAAGRGKRKNCSQVTGPAFRRRSIEFSFAASPHPGIRICAIGRAGEVVNRGQGYAGSHHEDRPLIECATVCGR